MAFQQLIPQKSSTLSAFFLLISQKKNIHESIPLSNSHHLYQIDLNDEPMYFCHATETETVESIMQSNKVGDRNDVSRKFLVMCKNHVSFHFKELFNFFIDIFVFPNVFKIAKITPIHKKIFTSQFTKLSPGFCTYKPQQSFRKSSIYSSSMFYSRIQLSKFLLSKYARWAVTLTVLMAIWLIALTVFNLSATIFAERVFFFLNK